VGNTSGGMFSQIKNNITQALGSLAGPLLEAFKPVLAIGVKMSAGLKDGVSKMQPVIAMAGGAIASALKAIGTVATTVFGGLFAAGKWSFDSILDKAMVFWTTLKFGFENFGAVAKLAWDYFALYAVTAFEKIKHFFLVEGPAYLSTFATNLKRLLSGQNMIETIIPDRQLTALELDLASSVNGLGDQLGAELDAKIAEARALLDQEVTPPEIKDAKDQQSKTDEAATKAADRSAQNTAATVRSSEGQSVFAQFAKALGKDGIEKRAQKAQIDAAKDLHDIRRSVVRNGKPLTGKQWN
jgi:hypothetical protein